MVTSDEQQRPSPSSTRAQRTSTGSASCVPVQPLPGPQGDGGRRTSSATTATARSRGSGPRPPGRRIRHGGHPASATGPCSAPGGSRLSPKCNVTAALRDPHQSPRSGRGIRSDRESRGRCGGGPGKRVGRRDRGEIGAELVDGGVKWSTVVRSGGEVRVQAWGGGSMWRSLVTTSATRRLPRRRWGSARAAASSAPTTPRLDDKGRLFLPAKFRDRLAGGPRDHPGPGALPLRLPGRRVRPDLRAASGRRRSPARRPATTSGCSSPAPPTRPRTSRAGSPSRRTLRDYAGLTKDCVVIGAGTRVEVWDAEAWDTYRAEQEAAFADLSEEVLPG